MGTASSNLGLDSFFYKTNYLGFDSFLFGNIKPSSAEVRFAVLESIVVAVLNVPLISPIISVVLWVSCNKWLGVLSSCLTRSQKPRPLLGLSTTNLRLVLFGS